jgi:hypothetical protein
MMVGIATLNKEEAERQHDRAEIAEAALAHAEQEAFDAGWHAGIDQTDKYGETHETPDEALAAYRLSRSRRDTLKDNPV